MPDSIIDGTGSGYPVAVNEFNRMLVDISGAQLFIGSVSANVDSIYVQSGVTYIDQVPTFSGANPELDLIYITSGTATGVTGSEIGSIIKYFGAGSFIQVLTYSNNNLVNIGSFV